MQLLNIKDVDIARNYIVLICSVDIADYTYILFLGTISYYFNVYISSCIPKKPFDLTTTCDLSAM